jgi:hypothetical protein
VRTLDFGLLGVTGRILHPKAEIGLLMVLAGAGRTGVRAFGALLMAVLVPALLVAIYLCALIA